MKKVKLDDRKEYRWKIRASSPFTNNAMLSSLAIILIASQQINGIYSQGKNNHQDLIVYMKQTTIFFSAFLGWSIATPFGFGSSVHDLNFWVFSFRSFHKRDALAAINTMK